MFSAGVTVCGPELVIDGILGAGEAARPLLTQKLLGQLERIGQEGGSLLGPLFPPPPVKLSVGSRVVSSELLSVPLGQLPLLSCTASLAT